MRALVNRLVGSVRNVVAQSARISVVIEIDLGFDVDRDLGTAGHEHRVEDLT